MTPKIRSDINITPLVDIVLVLLIVFITLVPVLPRALDTGLPHGGGTGRETSILRLTLAADGSLDLDGARVALADLPARIRATTGSVVLRVHPSLPLDRATGVLDAVKAGRPDAVPALIATPEGP